MKKTESKKQVMTSSDYFKEAERRFGKVQDNWKFVCPCCKHIASILDCKNAGMPSSAIGFSCIGRWLGAKREAFGEGEGPCNYAGGGLFRLNPIHLSDLNSDYFELALADEVHADINNERLYLIGSESTD